MTGASGDALDWALAPEHGRGDLAASALPGDAVLLLQVAAGLAGGMLAAAAERHRMGVAEAMQKVRTRLRAMLFHPQADAYRVLGLDIGADADAIKLHHRLLQQWLHPDRHPGEQDALLAARVNAAWQALRTPERRMAYDAEQSMRKAALARAEAAAVPAATLVPVDPASGWRRLAPLLALGGGFLGLFGLALYDQRMDGLAEEQAGPADPTSVAVVAPTPAPAGDRPVAAPPVRPAMPALVAEAPRVAPVEAAPPARLIAVNDDDTAFDGPAAPAAPAATATAARPRRDAPAISAAPVASIEVAPIERPQSAASVAGSIVAAEAPKDDADAIAAAAAVMPSVAQVRAAERTGARLLAFLRNDIDRVPPIWNSLSAQRDAMQLREGGRLEVPASDPPAWRVGSRAASMRARLAVREGETRTWLVAQMVWREQRWLVEEVAVTGGMP